jgi:predicted nucleic acid-binding protein
LRSRQATLKVLLDTTFILPSLGIDVGEEVSKGLKKLADIKAEIYCSRFSILETLWVAARLSSSVNFNAENFRTGLRSILESGRYMKAEEDSEIFNDALRLYMIGHKDMIDNILYTSSIHLNLKLLTLDTELKKFINNKGLNDTLIHPNQIS